MIGIEWGNEIRVMIRFSKYSDFIGTNKCHFGCANLITIFGISFASINSYVLYFLEILEDQRRIVSLQEFKSDPRGCWQVTFAAIR